MSHRSEIAITDISPEASGRFYTYVYRDVREGREGVAIYVGKGTENPRYGKSGRARFHWARKCSSRGLQEILHDLRASGLEPIIEIVGRFNTEPEAFAHESELIAKYGRRDLRLGSLCNLSDGGEGPVGFRHAADAIAKIGAASKRMHENQEIAARRAANISAALSRPTTRALRAQIMREVHARPGARAKRIAAQKAAFATAEYKARQSEASRKSQARPETKARHSSSLKARWAVPGAKDDQSAAMRRLCADPAYKKKHADAIKAYFASAEYAAKRAAKNLQAALGGL